MVNPIYTAGIAAASNIAGVHMANKAAKSSAKDQMEFQERMSNTSYQRGMADMRKAGLNPMLAYQLGGASSPTGSKYQPISYGGAADTAINAYSAQSQASLREEQESLTQAQKGQIKEQTKKIKTEVEQMKDLHNERWQRLFATMGPENIAASVAAALYGVNVQTLLNQVGGNVGVNVREDLERLLQATQEQKSFLLREGLGFGELIKAIFPSYMTGSIKGNRPHGDPSTTFTFDASRDLGSTYFRK
jgi:hypothetical protein